METGEKIRKIRQLKDLSQEYIAMQLGVSQNHYSRLERGESKISQDRLQEIANLLEVEEEDILSFDDYLARGGSGDSKAVKKIASIINIWKNERRLYKAIIKMKDNEIAFLRKLIDGNGKKQ